MAFHEIRFPDRLSAGSTGGPERRTEIVTLASGHEQRNTPWEASRRRYDAGWGLTSLDDLAEVIAFFEARRGALHGFRWKDWLDCKSCAPSATPAPTDQEIGIGDGQRTVFPLSRRYDFGPNPWTRRVVKPVKGSVRVAVDGAERSPEVAFSVDETTGEVAFLTPPAAGRSVTAGFEFDVPVRFDTDRIEASLASIDAGEAPSIPVVEIRI